MPRCVGRLDDDLVIAFAFWRATHPFPEDLGRVFAARIIEPAYASAVARSVHHGAVTFETGRATYVDPSNVETRDDFARFLAAVLADFRSTGHATWENSSLVRVLDGLSAFAGACVVNAPRLDQEQASWRLFADIVRAAAGYE